MRLLRTGGAGGTGTCGRVSEFEPAPADFFSITTLPGFFVVTLTPNDCPPHPLECDVMQRC